MRQRTTTFCPPDWTRPATVYGEDAVTPDAADTSAPAGFCTPSPGSARSEVTVGAAPEKSRNHTVAWSFPLELHDEPTIMLASFNPIAVPCVHPLPAILGSSVPVVCHRCVTGSRHQYTGPDVPLPTTACPPS